MTEQPRTSGAVFISYASEDADAATRICEALRAAGVEVWFDKSELRGGDAWDSQIKKQIHDCALFLPLISAHTNARTEGYFRREWNLAKRRLLDRADDAAFLVPVVIDETRDGDARVPEEFLHVQWTQLPAGETPPAFAQRVRQLLGLDHLSTSKAAATFKPSAGEPGSVRPSSTRLKRKFAFPIIVLLLVLGGGLFWYFQGIGDTPAATPATATVAVAPNDKSIAVLPFLNISSDPEQEYFSDGLSEEVLNLLVKLPELKVIARTSSFAYKGKDTKIADIARELQVAHVLEGSVRKAGEKLRITAQLVRASDSTHLWSQTYDRELTDILAVQGDIAAQVVRALEVALLGGEPATAARSRDAEAYDLLLQGRFFAKRRNREDVEIAIRYLQQSLEHDPTYAPAWVELANVYLAAADIDWVPSPESYALARSAVEKALALDPKLAGAHSTMGWIQSGADWNWAAAEVSFRNALTLEPGNAETLSRAGMLAAELGQPEEALALLWKSTERDPLRVDGYSALAFTLASIGHYSEAEAMYGKVLELAPNREVAYARLGRSLLLQGRAKDALRVLERETDEVSQLAGLSLVYHTLGRQSEADSALASLKGNHADSPVLIAEVHAWRGEKDLAFEWLNRAYVQRNPNLADLKANPFLRRLAGDPRYKELLLKMKLPV